MLLRLFLFMCGVLDDRGKISETKLDWFSVLAAGTFHEGKRVFTVERRRLKELDSVMNRKLSKSFYQ